MQPLIVITGASGFIGSHLLDAFSWGDYRVLGLSRHVENEHLYLNRITDYAQYEPPAGAILVHLAQTRDVQVAAAAGQQHIEATVALCEQLLEKPWGHAIYASSAEVYGDQIIAARCACEPVAPQNAYATARQLCEQMALKKGGTVLRLANVYGPGMADNNVISDILRQLPGDEPLLVEDTTPVRDFIWIGDVVAGFIAAINFREKGIFNLGSGRGTSISDLSTLTLNLSGQGFRQVQSKKVNSSPSYLVLDINETQRILHWTPVTPLEQGLNQLIQMHVCENA